MCMGPVSTIDPEKDLPSIIPLTKSLQDLHSTPLYWIALFLFVDLRYIIQLDKREIPYLLYHSINKVLRLGFLCRSLLGTLQQATTVSQLVVIPDVMCREVHRCVCEWPTHIKWVQVGDGSSVRGVHIQVVTLEDVKYTVVVLTPVTPGCIVDADG